MVGQVSSFTQARINFRQNVLSAPDKKAGVCFGEDNFQSSLDENEKWVLYSVGLLFIKAKDQGQVYPEDSEIMDVLSKTMPKSLIRETLESLRTKRYLIDATFEGLTPIGKIPSTGKGWSAFQQMLKSPPSPSQALQDAIDNLSDEQTQVMKVLGELTGVTKPKSLWAKLNYPLWNLTSEGKLKKYLQAEKGITKEKCEAILDELSELFLIIEAQNELGATAIGPSQQGIDYLHKKYGRPPNTFSRRLENLGRMIYKRMKSPE